METFERSPLEILTGRGEKYNEVRNARVSSLARTGSHVLCGTDRSVYVVWTRSSWNILFFFFVSFCPIYSGEIVVLPSRC